MKFSQKLRDAFKAASTDGGTQIGISAVRGVLESVERPELVEQVMGTMRKMGKSDIKFNDFMSVVFESMNTPGASMKFQETFRALDTDGSGFISEDELRKALGEGGVLHEFGFPASEANDLIAAFDKDEDGKINYIEFVPSLLADLMDITLCQT